LLGLLLLGAILGPPRPDRSLRLLAGAGLERRLDLAALAASGAGVHDVRGQGLIAVWAVH